MRKITCSLKLPVKNNNTSFLAIGFLVILFLSACSRKHYTGTNKVYMDKAHDFARLIVSEPRDTINADSLRHAAEWTGTTNFNLRKPNMVIIHHTAQNSCAQTLTTFTLDRTQVSAHYVICKDGTLHHMLNDYLRAWHAGAARWGNSTDINSTSIGIEIDNNGFEDFTPAQINVLLGLLSNLKKTYGIPVANFIGHGDIAPTRKNDPNFRFPWKALADSGYGKWYKDTTGLQVDPFFNPIYALRVIGYDISNYPAAVQAFRRHFIGVDKPGELTEPERKVLFALVREYL